MTCPVCPQTAGHRGSHGVLDETADNQVVLDGHHLVLDGADQVEAVWRMVERGVSRDEICARLGIRPKRYDYLVRWYKMERPEEFSWTRWLKEHSHL